MPRPAQSRPETDPTHTHSLRSDVDETVTVANAPTPGAPAGFGPPAEAGEVGTLGPYRLVKELGHGGMGAVYAALDTRLDRRLALKVMLPEFAADTAARERFLREARAAAKVKHDNVITVYEADERDGVPYIAMEYLEGYPLDAYLKKKGNPTIPQVLRIAAETAAGLAAAHRIGLVHRDIKPANLWLEAPNGRVKVLDFGLARPVDAEVELTKRGAVVGTPAFMSPEQARGEKVDHRTDLFSLGAVMYRLCTGKLPFHGPTTMAVLMALGTEEPPPVREVNPDVPEPLAALIHQLLAKRADARPPSAAEVAKRVRAIASDLAAPRALPVEESASQPQVVYVPIQVTAVPPEENPFADIEASQPDAPADVSAPPEPRPQRAKPRGLSPWAIAVGAVALAALVVGGVVIIIKNKDGSETKIEVPDGATVTVKGKDGKTLAQVGPGGKQPAANADADRKAAEWVIAQGGAARVNGEERDIKAATELPKERFTLTAVNLGNTKVSDAGLAQLKGCTGLTDLHLYNTQVTDAGLDHLRDQAEIKVVSLHYTQVTNTGLARLKALKHLTHLNLAGTPVTDAGLEHLRELKNLTYLVVQATKVTAKGLAEFHAAVPGCQIAHDGGVIEAVDVDRTAAEWVIAQGGSVRVTGVRADVKAAAELPKERFTLGYVNLADRPVSDAGLVQLKELKGLEKLYLYGTKVSDAGLAHLKGLKSLTYLRLDRTPVSDAGLGHLKGLKALTYLAVNQTKLTATGLAEFHAAVPGCKIAHDGGVIEPKK